MRARASPLVALQTSFAMNADVAAKSDVCQPESQKQFREAIGLRTRHLQSESVIYEQKLGDLHLMLTGEDRWFCTKSSVCLRDQSFLWFHHVSSVFSPEDLVGRSFKKDAGLDEIEAAMKSRQAEIDKLLKATEAAIARPLACKTLCEIVGMNVNVSIFTLYKDVLDCQTIYILSLLQRDGLRQDDGNSLEPSIYSLTGLHRCTWRICI